MVEFSERERRACRLLSHLKYNRDTDKYSNCLFNDLLLSISKYILRIDPYVLFKKVAQYIDEKENA